MKQTYPSLLPDNNSRALVVFSNNVRAGYLRLLKRGFRHCFVMLPQNERGTVWLSCDPLSNHMEIGAHEIADGFDLTDWLRGQGCTVIDAPVNHSHKRAAPIMLLTCVEVVKRVLGIHKFGIFTPWQLYKFIKKQHPKKEF